MELNATSYRDLNHLL